MVLYFLMPGTELCAQSTQDVKWRNVLDGIVTSDKAPNGKEMYGYKHIIRSEHDKNYGVLPTYDGWCKPAGEGDFPGYIDKNGNGKFDPGEVGTKFHYWIWYTIKVSGELLDVGKLPIVPGVHPDAKKWVDEKAKGPGLATISGTGDFAAAGYPRGAKYEPALSYMCRGPFCVQVEVELNYNYDQVNKAIGYARVVNPNELNEIVAKFRENTVDLATATAREVAGKLDQYLQPYSALYPPDVRKLMPTLADFPAGFKLMEPVDFSKPNAWMSEYFVLPGANNERKEYYYINVTTQWLSDYNSYNDVQLELNKRFDFEVKNSMKEPLPITITGADKAYQMLSRIGSIPDGENQEYVIARKNNVYCKIYGTNIASALAPTRAADIATLIMTRIGGGTAVMPSKKPKGPRKLKANASAKEIRADGAHKFTIKAVVTDAENKPAGNVVVDVKSPGNSVEPLGPYATDGKGIVMIDCKVRERITDTNSVLHTLTVSILDEVPAVSVPVKITLQPMQRITLNMKDLTGKPAENEPVKFTVIQPAPGVIDMDVEKEQTSYTDGKGNISVPFPDETKIELYYKAPPNVPFKKVVSCPAELHELKLNADTAVSEVREGYAAFMRKIGVSEDKIKELMNLPVVKSDKTRLIVSGLSNTVTSIEMPAPENNRASILEMEKNFSHELGHWLSAAVMDTKKSAGEGHDSIWVPCSNEVNGFEEAEAHFIAFQYLKAAGRSYDPAISAGIKLQEKSSDAVKAKRTEGILAVFLNTYYSAQSADGKSKGLSPEEAIKDFKNTIEASNGGIRDIESFVKAKESGNGFKLSNERTDGLMKEYGLK